MKRDNGKGAACKYASDELMSLQSIYIHRFG